MSGGVFLVRDSGELVEMRENAYDTEALLQELLARYPSLLAGDQINATAPRRWLFVSREVGVPDAQDGAVRWSLDHLFLDQDAVPTLVEVKRSSDTRIRREVVGQMLDYAANAIVYWPVEAIRKQFETRCEREGIDPQQELADFLSAEADTDRFWVDVKTNLQAGRVRLVFVADVIPPELQRIIEFLNGQMSSAEVLGIAIPQYTGQGHKVFVPRVIGQTAIARQQKSAGATDARQWDEASFFEELTTQRGAVDVIVARKLLEWAKSHGLEIRWGRGKRSGSFVAVANASDRSGSLIAVYTYGSVEVQFETLRRMHPFEDENLRRDAILRFNTIAGVNMTDTSLTVRPSIRLPLLQDDKAFDAFTQTLEWIVDTLRH